MVSVNKNTFFTQRHLCRGNVRPCLCFLLKYCNKYCKKFTLLLNTCDIWDFVHTTTFSFSSFSPHLGLPSTLRHRFFFSRKTAIWNRVVVWTVKIEVFENDAESLVMWLILYWHICYDYTVTVPVMCCSFSHCCYRYVALYFVQSCKDDKINSRLLFCGKTWEQLGFRSYIMVIE